MPTEPQLPDAIQALLRCPKCTAPLARDGVRFLCTAAACGAAFPVVGGVPILIDEQTSVFSIADYLPHAGAAIPGAPPAPLPLRGRLKRGLMRLTPSISRNVKGARNYQRFAELLLARTPHPRVLVVGGEILGYGMESLMANPAIELVETDVALGPRTGLVCDAHALPFADGSFDGVIAQAVLEHVVDPHRCVGQIHRVLGQEGLVYAETPFMQQVHGGRYDFTRFTYLGHRRLFRYFEEIESGAVCGPGMALAWSYQHFLLSFTTRPALRTLLKAFSSLTSFFLKYCDAGLIDKPGTLDAASGYYFIGRKGEHPLPDRELLQLYKGALG